jgi:hypothetical protein
MLHRPGKLAGTTGLFKRPDVRFFAPTRHRGWRSSEW